jgi:putative phosphoesterase
MKIGVISDTHGSLSAWLNAYTYLADTDFIIHCGDVLYHGPRNPLPEGYNPGELAKRLNDLKIPLYIVGGNCDADVDQMLLEYPIEPHFAHIITEEYRILVHHGHQNFNFNKALTQYSLIISGHTHIPTIERKNGVIHLNPGSPSLPKNEPNIPTLAVVDSGKISIINITNGQILSEFQS